MRHIVWDWNGTLFDDIDAVVTATNTVFSPYGIRPLDLAGFRAFYRRPIWDAYADLLGRPLADGEWEQLDQGYHDNYHRLMTVCDLTADTRAALGSVTASGGRQSLLSMWHHDRLVPTVQRFGLDGQLALIDGLRGEGGGPKASYLATHLDALGVDPADALVVGDSVDDAVAAAAVGAEAVVFTGGMSSRAALAATGVPVVDTLTAALRFA